MEKQIQSLLNKVSFLAIITATLTLILLFIRTPESCFNPNTLLKPHQKFPKSSCDASHRTLTSPEKQSRRIWATKAWKNGVVSLVTTFLHLRDLKYFHNNSHVLCVSAGAGHCVVAFREVGVSEITAVEIVESVPLVSRADPHNLPFFDGVFDLGFSGVFDLALFPGRYAEEMERVVKVGGVCVVAVEECGEKVVKEVGKLMLLVRNVFASELGGS
ncbi:S-adenosyl-L-methionine-dependent methyltransferase-like protein [Heracleum sosnowskyi]|uniref:S-adenosyl-L-methionine-dependent methyltransferase-like protein n=1 Tax=Heracleum sosnowskyi TaxID=360622 RepID=A0AAD8IZN2_9APIA|nr:S-adenosyl-L-methionine-dependent methyltransferase-like protein [Heracleum sosnowskyi]